MLPPCMGHHSDSLLLWLSGFNDTIILSLAKCYDHLVEGNVVGECSNHSHSAKCVH